MIVREQQMQEFERLAARNFESEMVGHLRQFAPRHSEVIGESGVRQVARLGIERAGQCGFTNRGPIRLYLEMMFMFGSGFATDPLLPWAGAVLSDPEIQDQTTRADVLYGKTVEYLERVGGPRNQYTLIALRRISEARLEDFPSSGSFEDRVVTGFQKIYPEKCEYAGEPALRTLIQRGMERARGYQIATETGAGVFLAMMFAVGHDFASDPLFPWASATLNDPAIPDANLRAERLRDRATAYVKRALTYLEQR